jgi:hypothetical protein
MVEFTHRKCKTADLRKLDGIDENREIIQYFNRKNRWKQISKTLNTNVSAAKCTQQN